MIAMSRVIQLEVCTRLPNRTRGSTLLPVHETRHIAHLLVIGVAYMPWWWAFQGSGNSRIPASVDTPSARVASWIRAPGGTPVGSYPARERAHGHDRFHGGVVAGTHDPAAVVVGGGAAGLRGVPAALRVGAVAHVGLGVALTVTVRRLREGGRQFQQHSARAAEGLAAHAGPELSRRGSRPCPESAVSRQ